MRTSSPAWAPERAYGLGSVATWRGDRDLPAVRLLCAEAHDAGDAEHPWDPAAGRPAADAAALWAPDGEAEAGRLLAIVRAIRDDRTYGPTELYMLVGTDRARWTYAHAERLWAIAAELVRLPAS